MHSFALDLMEVTSGVLWIVYSASYTIAATAKTLLTKSAFSVYDFDYPILFSLLNVATTFVALSCLFLAGISKYSPFPWQHWQTLAWLTILTAGTMVAQNMAMNLLSVALQQALRGTLPIAVVALEKIIEGKMHSYAIQVCAVPLMLAPVLASWGTMITSEWSTFGAVCMLVSVLASAAKDVLLHFKIRELKRDIGLVSLLFWLQIGMGIILLPWAAARKQMVAVQEWEHYSSFECWIFVLSVTLLGGVRSYAQQLVLTLDSALFLVFCNALIQTLSVFISIPAFGTKMDEELWIGSVLSILACAMYAAVRKVERASEPRNTGAGGSGGGDVIKKTPQPAGTVLVSRPMAAPSEQPAAGVAAMVAAL